MKSKSLLILAGLVFSFQSHANNENEKSIGVSTGDQGTSLIFDVANKKDENIIGIKGNYPLSQKARALEHFKDRMEQRSSSVELYGVIDVGYQHNTK